MKTSTPHDELIKRFGGDGSVVGYTYRGVRLVSVSARSVVFGCSGGFSFAQTTQPMNVKRTLIEIDAHLASGMTVVDGNLVRSVRPESETVPCDHEYEAYCPNCGIDAPDDDQDGTGILYDEDGNSEYEKAMGAPYDDTDTTQTTKEV